MNAIKKVLTLCAAFLSFAATGFAQDISPSNDSVGIAIVYDTSGSMRQPVKDGTGKTAAKYVIANRALNAVIDRLEKVSSKNARKIQSSIVTFSGSTGKEVVPFGDFDAAKMRQWVKNFSQPEGGTPLGEAIKVAASSLLDSHCRHKHILVISDGLSNAGMSPDAAMSQLKKAADKKETGVSFHFIAFDIKASVFEPVKKLGATVVGAANEQELNTQLSFILEKKILLEDEEPPVKKEKK
ncbi:MAG: hypothetical protein JWM68_309 [Verrucomicrobiales bacterium]|nr:hypothetical protein [Verrucomicrobiales bacterium]